MQPAASEPVEPRVEPEPMEPEAALDGEAAAAVAVDAILGDIVESEEDEEVINTTVDGMVESEEEGDAVDGVVDDIIAAEP